MKKLVAELEGAELDYWVARAEGEPAIFDHGVCKYHYDDEHGTWDENWKPSTDWAQGGPIIEREKIALCTDVMGTWMATCGYTAGVRDWFSGQPTPLIAAMRCYVAMQFGNEVDMPNENLPIR